MSYTVTFKKVFTGIEQDDEGEALDEAAHKLGEAIASQMGTLDDFFDTSVGRERLVRTTLELEQYQCERCGRFFYINKMDKSSFDLSFGCPYGCDDAGRHTRTLKTEVREVIDIPHAESEEE